MRFCTLPILGLLLATPGRGDGGESLLCAFTDAQGTIRVLAIDGGLKVVSDRAERRSTLCVADLKNLGGPVIDAKVIPFPQGFAVALVARREGAFSYHYLVDKARPDGVLVSPALFTTPGEPYRIAEMLNPSGDSLQVTFCRGLLGPDKAPEIKVFSDTCASAPSGIVAGKSRLVDMVPGK